jgi:hypothetical protein
VDACLTFGAVRARRHCIREREVCRSHRADVFAILRNALQPQAVGLAGFGSYTRTALSLFLSLRRMRDHIAPQEVSLSPGALRTYDSAVASQHVQQMQEVDGVDLAVLAAWLQRFQAALHETVHMPAANTAQQQYAHLLVLPRGGALIQHQRVELVEFGGELEHPDMIVGEAFVLQPRQRLHQWPLRLQQTNTPRSARFRAYRRGAFAAKKENRLTSIHRGQSEGSLEAAGRTCSRRPTDISTIAELPR